MTMEQILALAKAVSGGTPRLLCAVGAVALTIAGTHGEAFGQQRIRPGETIAQPVVQPLPNRDNQRLTAALSRLGRNPRDLDALIDAGNAALALGDVDAAAGFFKRADQVSSNDPRIKTGLAGALVRSGNPLEALPLFDEAERAGAQLAVLAPDRGLAYDLVGDNATAQRLYRLALQRGPDEEVTHRLALSLAMSGDKRGAEATLLPLLQQQSKAAWRTRTFALAIMGEADEAIRIARTILPEALADSMAPYLRYMPQLTKAQQAAAANLGNFPRASEIGRDDPRLAEYIAKAVRPPSLAGADVALVPRGEPLGRTARPRTDRAAVQESARSDDARQPRSSRTAARSAERVAPPVPQPTREVSATPGAPGAAAPPSASPPQRMAAPTAPSGSSPVPKVAEIADRASAAVPSSRPAEVAFAPALPTAAVPQATPDGSATAPAAQPGFDLARLPQTEAPARAAPPPTAVAARHESRISLAEAFSDLGTPSLGAAPVVAGAVDITRITAARPRSEPAKVAPPKPPPPSHPSRIWVQLGIGRDRGALVWDWRKLSRQAAVLKGKTPYISDMGQTNRMLVGPFESKNQADKFIVDLRDAGVSGSYVWNSPAGQVVDALPIR